MRLLQDRLINELTVWKFLLQACTHCQGERELIHGKVDAPELDIGLLKDLAAKGAGGRGDVLTDIKCLGIFDTCFFLETEFLVMITDIGKRAGGLQPGLQAQLLIGYLRLCDPHISQVALDTLGIGG